MTIVVGEEEQQEGNKAAVAAVVVAHKGGDGDGGKEVREEEAALLGEGEQVGSHHSEGPKAPGTQQQQQQQQQDEKKSKDEEATVLLGSHIAMLELPTSSKASSKNTSSVHTPVELIGGTAFTFPSPILASTPTTENRTGMNEAKTPFISQQHADVSRSQESPLPGSNCEENASPSTYVPPPPHKHGILQIGPSPDTFLSLPPPRPRSISGRVRQVLTRSQRQKREDAQLRLQRQQQQELLSRSLAHGSTAPHASQLGCAPPAHNSFAAGREYECNGVVTHLDATRTWSPSDVQPANSSVRGCLSPKEDISSAFLLGKRGKRRMKKESKQQKSAEKKWIKQLQAERARREKQVRRLEKQAKQHSPNASALTPSDLSETYDANASFVVATKANKPLKKAEAENLFRSQTAALRIYCSQVDPSITYRVIPIGIDTSVKEIKDVLLKGLPEAERAQFVLTYAEDVHFAADDASSLSKGSRKHRFFRRQPKQDASVIEGLALAQLTTKRPVWTQTSVAAMDGDAGHYVRVLDDDDLPYLRGFHLRSGRLQFVKLPSFEDSENESESMREREESMSFVVNRSRIAAYQPPQANDSIIHRVDSEPSPIPLFWQGHTEGVMLRRRRDGELACFGPGLHLLDVCDAGQQGHAASQAMFASTKSMRTLPSRGDGSATTPGVPDTDGVTEQGVDSDKAATSSSKVLESPPSHARVASSGDEEGVAHDYSHSESDNDRCSGDGNNSTSRLADEEAATSKSASSESSGHGSVVVVNEMNLPPMVLPVLTGTEASTFQASSDDETTSRTLPKSELHSHSSRMLQQQPPGSDPAMALLEGATDPSGASQCAPQITLLHFTPKTEEGFGTTEELVVGDAVFDARAMALGNCSDAEDGPDSADEDVNLQVIREKVASQPPPLPCIHSAETQEEDWNRWHKEFRAWQTQMQPPSMLTFESEPVVVPGAPRNSVAMMLGLCEEGEAVDASQDRVATTAPPHAPEGSKSLPVGERASALFGSEHGSELRVLDDDDVVSSADMLQAVAETESVCSATSSKSGHLSQISVTETLAVRVYDKWRLLKRGLVDGLCKVDMEDYRSSHPKYANTKFAPKKNRKGKKKRAKTKKKGPSSEKAADDSNAAQLVAKVGRMGSASTVASHPRMVSFSPRDSRSSSTRSTPVPFATDPMRGGSRGSLQSSRLVNEVTVDARGVVDDALDTMSTVSMAELGEATPDVGQRLSGLGVVESGLEGRPRSGVERQPEDRLVDIEATLVRSHSAVTSSASTSTSRVGSREQSFLLRRESSLDGLDAEDKRLSMLFEQHSAQLLQGSDEVSDRYVAQLRKARGAGSRNGRPVSPATTISTTLTARSATPLPEPHILWLLGRLAKVVGIVTGVEKSRSRDVHRVLDGDNDGYITRADLHGAVIFFGLDFTPQETNALFDYMDENADNLLDGMEFSKHMQVRHIHSEFNPARRRKKLGKKKRSKVVLGQILLDEALNEGNGTDETDLLFV